MVTDDAHVNRDGARIAYRFDGAGVLLGHAHGLMSSRDHERRLSAFHPEEIAGRRLLRYDARGHGLSTGRAVDSDYHFTNHAADLLVVLDDAGITEPVDFMGASMGTAALLWAAVNAPRRFHRLILVVPPTAWRERIEQARWYREAATIVERQGVEPLRRAMAVMDPPEIFAGRPRRDVPPDVAESLLPAVLRGAADSDLPSPEQISALSHQTLILAWETDPVHPVSTARRLHALLPNARLHVSDTMDDVASWPRRIGEFLSQRLARWRHNRFETRMW